MFERIRRYVYDRRRGLLTVAGVVGTLYMAGKYIVDRFEEMREQAFQLQKARENLRRRFQQNQEDVLFTIMAHLPTLGKSLLEGMDVESVTSELQRKSKASRGRASSPHVGSSDTSLASSVELTRDSQSHDARSGSGTEASPTGGSSRLGDSAFSMPSQAQSWVEEFNSQLASSSRHTDSLSVLSLSSGQPEPSHGSPQSNAATNLSDSMMSDSIASTSASERSPSRVRDHDQSALSSKSKAELWNEVRMLTFTRTLTIIYSTTLLSLLTTMQLNMIGRSKYIQSVIQLHREEKLRERRMFQASVSSLFFGGLPEGEADLEQWLDEDLQDAGLVTEETERKFLTLSWWLLYVGWKDVGERVRRSVEEVFESVSLKSKLGHLELHRLISDVRRRVEYEFTYEGTERRINFQTTIIPPTPETLSMVLGEGGVQGYSTRPTHSSSQPPPRTQSARTLDPETDPAFARLLAELRQTIASPAFAHVLEKCLDRAADIFFENVKGNLFTASADPSAASEPEKIRLASLLPGLARWSHLALNAVPNELVDGIMDLKEMTAFAAIIYSRYEGQLR